MLMPGPRLGMHEMLSRRGDGGVGEVARARDTAFGRDVKLIAGFVLPRIVLATMLVVVTSWLGIDARAQAAGTTPAVPPGPLVLPDAAFDVTFQKFTPPANAFSPYYAWDARMGMDLTLLRRGVRAFQFVGVIQTVGTENLGTRVSVGGTGYILRLAYVHTYSAHSSVSAGISHLSSHLTRDLDAKTEEERQRARPIPHSVDPPEYNAIFVEGRRRFPSRRLAPELRIGLTPLSIRLNGRGLAPVRPVYAQTRWTIWRRRDTAAAIETQHEIGRNPLNRLSAVLDFRAGGQADGRFQVFASGAIGRGLQVSPMVGAVRDDIAAGIRLALVARAP